MRASGLWLILSAAALAPLPAAAAQPSPVAAGAPTLAFKHAPAFDRKALRLSLPGRSLRTLAGRIGIAAGGGLLETATSVTRAQDEASLGDAGMIRFRILGPTAEQTPLSDGEMLQQVGLRLRVRDTCNVLFVMWATTPREHIRVVLKTHPDMARFADCGAGGYTQVADFDRASYGFRSALQGGESSLAVRIVDDRFIRIYLNDGSAPLAIVDARANATLESFLTTIRGHTGVRSDNLRLSFELAVD